jgi:hypothetical protein
MLCVILRALSGSYELCDVVGYSAVKYVYEPTFQRNVSPPFSGRNLVRQRSVVRQVPCHPMNALRLILTLRMDLLYCAEKPVHIGTIRRCIPGDVNFHGCNCDDVKF